ncbi:MAG TPA: amidohydrolase family protein, partial [Anaeromyxobacter sp.]|nr:amidohydrolase family protein [Anaeromyxobacter sp.]
WLHSKASGNLFSAEELVAMVTRVAAQIVRWDDRLGTLEAGKIADLTLLSTRDADPYRNAILATEPDVRLAVVGGIPRYGHPDLMGALVTPDKDLETLSIAGQLRTIDLETTDPRVPTIRFAEAQAQLADALQNLPALEKQQTTHLTRFLAARAPPVEPGWTLALDETEPTGFAMRPEFGGPPADRARRHVAAARVTAKLPTVPVRLDPPSIADDPRYWQVIAGERNLPGWLAQGLPPLYGAASPATRRHAGEPRPKRGVRPRTRKAAAAARRGGGAATAAAGRRGTADGRRRREAGRRRRAYRGAYTR